MSEKKNPSRHFAATQKFLDQVIEIKDKFLIPDQHYGIIPGCDRPSLYKGGAEKILTLMGCVIEFSKTDHTVDASSGFVSIEFEGIVKDSKGKYLGAGVGMINSFEPQYLYGDWITLKEPSKTEVYKKKMEDVGRYKFLPNKSKIWQERRRKNPDELIALSNTLLKMAKKRAYVDAVLTSFAASELFTQDIEGLTISPETATLKKELGELFIWAASKVESREDLTKIYNIVKSVQHEDMIIDTAKEYAEKFPKPEKVAA
jgi:hypothetical protein